MQYFKPKGFFQIKRLKRLYRHAFPKEERKPFSVIMKMQRLGKSDVWYFEEDGHFLGLAATINGEDRVLIDYFAVSEKKRGQGCGTRMLKSLIGHYSGREVFLEIEIPYEHSENYRERVRRKSFYLRSGLAEMGTRVKLFGVDMELLGTGSPITYDEYKSFYLENYGRFAYDNIQPVDGE